MTSARHPSTSRPVPPPAAPPRRAALSLLAALSLVAALLAVATLPAAAQDAPARIAGDDATTTAVALSQATFDSADAVVVARADDYADGLAAGPLAVALAAPLLLTAPDAIDDATLQEVTRLGATRAVIVGGPAAVSEGVRESLAGVVAEVRRISGANRYATALAIAEEVTGGAAPDVVYFVEGEHVDPARGWPDAVSASAVAGVAGAPILPVNAAFVPADILDRWTTWTDAAGIIVGGDQAVSPEVEATLAAAVVAEADGFAQGDSRTLSRLAGPTRDATSAAVYTHGVSVLGMDPAATHLIPAGSFAEGLAAGAAAGHRGTPTLMVGTSSLEETPTAADLLTEQATLITSPAAIGGSDAISDEVLAAVQARLAPTASPAAFCLTLLHHNDGESQLLGAPGDDRFGNLGRMVTLAAQEQAAPATDGCESSGVVTVTSGDNFLAGPEFNASLSRPEDQPIYDALGLARMGYDALDLGNHDFDFGPDVLERFITSFPAQGRPPFLSANLDFSAEPGLQALVDAGDIAPSVVVTKGGVDVGIIGLTTPSLPLISSPRDVVVDSDIVAAVTTQVEALTAGGVEHIILISHLQGLQEDIDLIGRISGVDAVVAGGGDEVLASTGDPLVPSDLGAIADTYPLVLQDAEGAAVPTVTTAGDYKYLGRLDLRFDADGDLLADQPFDPASSRMLRVADVALFDGVAVDAQVQAEVLDPVAAFVEGLDEDIIGTSAVALNGARPDIRQSETNLGNLMADALRATVLAQASDFGLTVDPARVVGLQNGGGIRNNNVIPAGDISQLTTFDIAPFSNFVVAIPDVTAAQLKAVLERGYAGVENAAGQFAHVANLVVEVDASRSAQVIDGDTGEVTTAGSRVVSAALDDGTVLVADGEVVAGAPTLTIATIDFLATGGDGYPLGGLDFTRLGRSYQQSLADLISGALGGQITAADYPEGGEGRITITGLEG